MKEINSRNDDELRGFYEKLLKILTSDESARLHTEEFLKKAVELEKLLVKKDQKDSQSKLFNYFSIKPTIIFPPGYRISIIGKLLFASKTYERVVEPSITMMQEEYFEAYMQKRFAMAHWIRFRFFFIFLQIVGMNLPLISSLLEIKEKFTSK